MEIWYRDGHPFQALHGPMKDPYKVVEYAEKLGLGTRQYELVDVFPVEEFVHPWDTSRLDKPVHVERSMDGKSDCRSACQPGVCQYWGKLNNEVEPAM